MDARTPHEKWLWEHVGPPLYYCEKCMREVQVSKEGVINRGECACDAGVIAPRRCIATGKGGASINTKLKTKIYQILALLTQRCV